MHQAAPARTSVLEIANLEPMAPDIPVEDLDQERKIVHTRHDRAEVDVRLRQKSLLEAENGDDAACRVVETVRSALQVGCPGREAVSRKEGSHPRQRGLVNASGLLSVRALLGARDATLSGSLDQRGGETRRRVASSSHVVHRRERGVEPRDDVGGCVRWNRSYFEQIPQNQDVQLERVLVGVCI